MVQRILASILLLISILFLPFWVSVILALAGIIYFSFYWEGVILFLLSDLLYGTQEGLFLNIISTSFVVSFLVLVITELVKKKLKFYNK